MVMWAPEQQLEDFRVVAKIAGVDLDADAIRIERLPAPHKPPSRLPSKMMAVYVFSLGSEVLKVGKVGPKSHARYTSQHYNPRSALSTLAASMLKDASVFGADKTDETNIGDWIRTRMDRVNFLLDESYGPRLLGLLESFLQCRLQPRYEGISR
jgi:hypothetical protein